MGIQVSKRKTPEQVQAEFCTVFPCLRLAFFEHPTWDGYNRTFPLTITYGGRMLHRPAPGAGDTMEEVEAIEGDMPVDQAERLLNAALGLHVRVLHRVGDRWHDTRPSQALTLVQQNALAYTSEVSR